MNNFLRFQHQERPQTAPPPAAGPVGEKIAAVANKVQTTRTAIRGIVNRPNAQIVFVDTPGIHKPKTKLSDTMVETAFGTIGEVDLVVFVVEADSKEIGKGDSKILEKIQR